MPTKQPQLGSLAIQAPQSPQTVHVQPGTCHDLSAFKEILREYRRLDDTITMRLNRANAAMRDSDRVDNSSENIQDRACLNVWRELVGLVHPLVTKAVVHESSGNWKRRTTLVEYCVLVMDESLKEKRSVVEEETLDNATKRKIQGHIIEEQVKGETSVHKYIMSSKWNP
ncbi:hypothetical protein H0H92_000846 [Tricholoma furcatifolium]|nr:hypothetical protein H0H92_000846 [Tricholoma furcatifolium]